MNSPAFASANCLQLSLVLRTSPERTSLQESFHSYELSEDTQMITLSQREWLKKTPA